MASDYAYFINRIYNHKKCHSNDELLHTNLILLHNVPPLHNTVQGVKFNPDTMYCPYKSTGNIQIFVICVLTFSMHNDHNIS